MSDDIGAIVVGTTYGVLTHVRALRQAGFSVRALVGRNPEKTSQRAARLEIPHAITDLGEALTLPGTDVVVVSTPPHTHAPITIAACAAGRHVLCEKPFALDVSEARQMLEAAQRAGVIHLLGTEYRFTTTQATLQQAVASGAIGTPKVAFFTVQLPSLLDPTVELPGWWESVAQGGGWLGAAGSHLIDQVRCTLGEFEWVSASLQTLSPRPQMTADDTYTIHARLAGGCTGVLHGSCAAPGPSMATTKIVGTDGALWLERGRGWNDEQVWVDDGTGPRRVPDRHDLPRTPPEPPPAEFLPEYATTTRWHTSGADLAPFTRLYNRLRARLRGEAVVDDPPAATFVDGVAAQAVLDAVRRAASEGAAVEVEKV